MACEKDDYDQLDTLHHKIGTLLKISKEMSNYASLYLFLTKTLARYFK